MEVRLLVDTNRLTDILRREPSVVRIVEDAEEVFVPFVALAEIEAGFLGGSPKRQAENEGLLQQFLQIPGVAPLYPDRETTRIFGRLFVQLRKAGTPVPTNDLWIASLALQHQLTVLTRDSHFHKIAQLMRI